MYNSARAFDCYTTTWTISKRRSRPRSAQTRAQRRPISCLYKLTFFLIANIVGTVHLRNVCYARIMKTYQLGTCGDRILTVKKTGGEHIVTIKLKDSDTKCIELPPKRWVILIYFILNFFHSFAVFTCFDRCVYPTNYAASAGGQHFVKS